MVDLISFSFCVCDNEDGTGSALVVHITLRGRNEKIKSDSNVYPNQMFS